MTRRYKKKNNQKAKMKGTTLIEMLVVIGIIGILIGLTTMGMKGLRERSKVTQAKSDVGKLSLAVQNLYNDTRMYPGYFSSISLGNDVEIPLNGKSTDFITKQPGNKHYYSDIAGLNKRCNDWSKNDTNAPSYNLNKCYDGWLGPYIPSSDFLSDPWGRPYEWDYDYYGPPYKEVQTVIASVGPDGWWNSCDDVYKPFYAREPKDGTGEQNNLDSQKNKDGPDDVEADNRVCKNLNQGKNKVD